MCKWQYMLVILTFITASTCDLQLRIYRTDGHLWVPVNDTIMETFGSKLHLYCLMYENKVVWGRKNKDLRFETVADLVKLAENGSKLLLDLDNNHNVPAVTRATQKFDSLSIDDRGTYFCMNLQNKLFKIINIQVYERLPCSEDQFKCENGKQCIPNHEVCDNLYQCSDSSDEKWERCSNQWRCIGGIPCGDHCIPTKWCCDKSTDKDCFVVVRNPCCPPLSNRSEISLHTFNNYETTRRPDFGYNLTVGIISAVVVVTACLIVFYAVRECLARNSDNSDTQNGIPLPPIIRTDDDNNPSILNSLMGMINSSYLDLPPTYADSTRNTPINSPPSSTHSSLEDITVDAVDHHSALPPTYDEAIANINSNSNSSLTNQPDTNINRSVFLDVPNARPGTSRDDI